VLTVGKDGEQLGEEGEGGTVTSSVCSEEEAVQLEGGGREGGRGPGEETEPVQKERGCVNK